MGWKMTTIILTRSTYSAHHSAQIVNEYKTGVKYIYVYSNGINMVFSSEYVTTALSRLSQKVSFLLDSIFWFLSNVTIISRCISNNEYRKFWSYQCWRNMSSSSNNIKHASSIPLISSSVIISLATINMIKNADQNGRELNTAKDVL